MRYSLLSRFQGVLLAAALGDDLGEEGRLKYHQRDQYDKAKVPHGIAFEPASLLTPVDLYSWHPGRSTAPSQATLVRSPSLSGTIALASANAVVQAGSWQERQIEQVGSQLDRIDHWRTTITAAELAIGTLPVILFFHDDVARLRQLLLQTAAGWQCSADTTLALLTMGYAIAQLLNEQLDPLTLIPQTVIYLKQGTVNHTGILLELTSKLEQVQILIQQGTGLHAATAQLRAELLNSEYGAIVLAFYCFLSTPNDLHLTMVRAARSGYTPSTVCALTGALSGAYNSITGLPLIWQLAMLESSNAATLKRWQTLGIALRQLAERLFTVWSGVYDFTTLTAAAPTAIAAPGTIRPR